MRLSMVLRSKGTASRTSSGSSSLAKVEELPAAMALPSELMAILLSEHPASDSARPLKAVARRAERNVAVMDLQCRTLHHLSILTPRYELGSAWGLRWRSVKYVSTMRRARLVDLRGAGTCVRGRGATSVQSHVHFESPRGGR